VFLKIDRAKFSFFVDFRLTKMYQRVQLTMPIVYRRFYTTMGIVYDLFRTMHNLEAMLDHDEDGPRLSPSRRQAVNYCIDRIAELQLTPHPEDMILPSVRIPTNHYDLSEWLYFFGFRSGELVDLTEDNESVESFESVESVHGDVIHDLDGIEDPGLMDSPVAIAELIDIIDIPPFDGLEMQMIVEPFAEMLPADDE